MIVDTLNKGVVISGDFRSFPPSKDVTLILADPVYDDLEMMNAILAFGKPTIMFSYAENIHGLDRCPDQVLFWVKPESTKNTIKKYSRFVEAINLFGVELNHDLHWSNRTGIFTDRLFSNEEHPWKKPESLIERLLLNHYKAPGIVYDPCAGSFTVKKVCDKLGIPSVSVELFA